MPPLYDSAMVIPALLAALLFLSSGAPAEAAPAADRLERFREIALSRLAVEGIFQGVSAEVGG